MICIVKTCTLHTIVASCTFGTCCGSILQVERAAVERLTAFLSFGICRSIYPGLYYEFQQFGNLANLEMYEKIYKNQKETEMAIFKYIRILQLKQKAFRFGLSDMTDFEKLNNTA